MQSDDIKPDLHLEPSQSKPQQGWKETTLYSVHRADGQPPVTKVFTKSGEGRHPMLSMTYQDPGRSKLQSSNLERLLAEVANAQQGSQGGKAAQPTGNLHYLGYVRPALDGQSQVAFASKTQRPNLDKPLFKGGSDRLTTKEPLSVMDGKIVYFFYYYRYLHHST